MCSAIVGMGLIRIQRRFSSSSQSSKLRACISSRVASGVWGLDGVDYMKPLEVRHTALFFRGRRVRQRIECEK